MTDACKEILDDWAKRLSSNPDLNSAEVREGPCPFCGVYGNAGMTHYDEFVQAGAVWKVAIASPGDSGFWSCTYFLWTCCDRSIGEVYRSESLRSPTLLVGFDLVDMGDPESPRVDGDGQQRPWWWHAQGSA